MAVNNHTVFLIGFMGSGKTTLGKKLAAKLGLQFVDLDEQICFTFHASRLSSLIEEKGIDFFREAESKVLKEIDVSGKLIATGGGTPCFFDNMDWMKSKGVVVYIELDEKTLFHRLKQTDLSERPLLKGLDNEGLKNFINRTLAERKQFYSQAHIALNPLVTDVNEMAERIRSFLPS
ncbi:MAG: AAA family ATPase [Chitinophagales bacterium]|nr:AAA family ATPase [Chitinophagales bacterium]